MIGGVGFADSYSALNERRLSRLVAGSEMSWGVFVDEFWRLMGINL